mgnify:FL=1
MKVPDSIKKKSMKDYTCTDCVFLTLQNAFVKQRWLTFQEIQTAIQKGFKKSGFSDLYVSQKRFYGSPTISASIRRIRHIDKREAYELPLDMEVEVIKKRRRSGSKGYEYSLDLRDLPNHKYNWSF